MTKSLFTWSDYLLLAETLVTSEDEAALRTAISRAYYASFHAARDLCSEFKIDLSRVPSNTREHDQSVHMRVILALRNQTDPSLWRAGSLLDSFRQLRNDADYKTRFEGDVPAAARRAIRDAHIVISHLAASRRQM